MTEEPNEIPPNEILAESRAAKRQGEAAEEAEAARGSRWPLAAVGLGIGSAALAGALIYAGRNRRAK